MLIFRVRMRSHVERHGVNPLCCSVVVFDAQVTQVKTLGIMQSNNFKYMIQDTLLRQRGGS